MSSGVEFDEDKLSYGGRPRYGGQSTSSVGGGFSYGQREETGMAGWLIRKGYAKTPGAAQGILIALVILNIIITYFVITYFI